MVGSAFAEVSLGEIADFRNGKALSPERYTSAGRNPVFGSNGQIARTDDVLCPEPAIAIGRVGAYCGSVHYIPKASWVTDNAIVALPKVGSDLRFLFYLLGSLELRRTAIGSAQPLMTQGGLKVVRTVAPPLAEQKAIAAVLGVLDDKIELNRRMNATLEAMVRALFQSWFVDFDPVRAKLDGRQPSGLDEATAALFPAAFQDSPLGPLPQGWNVMNVGDISARIAMGPFGSRITRDNFVPDGVPVVRGGNLTDGFVDDDFVFLTETKADELKASVAHSLDLVFTHRGTLGQVGIVPYQSRYPRYVVSQSQMLLSVHRHKISPWMVYLFFSSPIGEGALLANTSTTGVPAISRPTTSLKAIPLVVPPIAVSELFNEIVQPLFLQREQNAHQSRTLSTLRDTLLPKLLSGELSVRDLPALSNAARMDVVESVAG